MSKEKPLKFNEQKIKNIKAKYEVFEVGDELVFSDDREKIKEYAKMQGEDRITYKVSFESKEGAENMAEEI